MSGQGISAIFDHLVVPSRPVPLACSCFLVGLVFGFI